MTDTDEINRSFAQARTMAGDGRTATTQALAQMRELLPKVQQARPRGALNQQIWHCQTALGQTRDFFSQSGQDAWLNTHVFKNKRGGTFVEIGGYDGVTGSNCLFFELMRGWAGVLAEPSPAFHSQAKQARRCPCLRVAVAGTAGEAEFLDVEAGMTQMGGLVDSYDPKMRARIEAQPNHKGRVITVPTLPLAEILDQQGLTEIDYISLDVEGGEMDVLSAFPFRKYRITAWTIENNNGSTDISKLMQAQGYRLVEALGVDDVYCLATPA